MRTTYAMKYTEKVLNHITDLFESDSAIYGKTKDKLIEIGEMCAKIQQMISDTLETAKPRGFDPDTVERTDKKVDDLSKRVDTVEKKIDTIRSSKVEEQTTPKPKTPSVMPKPHTILSIEDEKRPKKPQITIEDSKKVLHTYAKVIESAANTDYHNVVVNRCCDLLWKWFDARILNHHKNRRFRYDVRNIKDYIAAFVVSFGYHIEQGDFERYADRIEDWNNRDSKYIYPYEVKAICIDKEFKYANTTSMVLWSALLKMCGYENLGRITLSTCTIGNVTDEVYSIVGDCEDTVNKSGIYTDAFVHDSENPNLLEKYKIV